MHAGQLEGRAAPAVSGGAALPDAPPLIAMEAISKRFPGVQALDAVDLRLGRGEVVGLAGENGSGKSTLMKVLAGMARPDAGRILLDGAEVRFRAAADALRVGIALIAQEVAVQPHLSVTENLLFGRLPTRGHLVDWSAAHRCADEWLNRIGLEVSTRRRVGDLPLHERHLLSVARVMIRRPDVVVLDEPTSSLGEAQVEILARLIDQARGEGTSIVYITHRLREYFRFCSRVVVLRDGSLVGERLTDEITEHDLVRMMVGREMHSIFERPGRQRCHGAPVFELLGVSTGDKLTGIDLAVAAGEIVGVSGQAGSGRSTLLRAAFGLVPFSGSMRLDNVELPLGSPGQRIRAGVAYVPEDRKAQGLVMSSSVADNLLMAGRSAVAHAGFRVRRQERRTTALLAELVRLRASSVDVPCATLSGGNQQKVAIAKWLVRRPRILLLDEPTRGVDVGAKAEIYRLIEQLADDGVAVLVASSELLELVRLCDRICVMAHGRLVGEVSGDDATEETLTHLSFTTPTSEGIHP